MPEAPKLLERERELKRLGERIRAARDGAGAAIVVDGPAGIGKSSLLDEACRIAPERRVTTLRACAAPLETELGYGVVRQLLGTEPVPAEGAAALARPALDVTPKAGSPDAVLHGLYWLTAGLAERGPLLLAVDDVHWADAPSRRFLAYLARRLHGLPVLLVMAVRTGEPGAAVTDLEADEHLRPAPLTEAGTALLVGAAPAGTARAWHRATGGNPFLIRELLRARTAADGDELAPEGVARSVAARLQRLGPAATGLAHAVAVLGGDARTRHAAALAGLEPDAAGDAADALAAAEILAPGRPLSFVHPVVRTTVYAARPAGRRARDHRRAAALLAAEDHPPEAIATHLLATEPAADPWVVEHLRAAAEHALERGAADTACTYLARAREEPPPPDARATVLCELGRAELRAGRPTAVATLTTALDRYRVVGAPVAELAVALTAGGDTLRAAQLLEAEIARVAPADREQALRLEALLAGTMQMALPTAGLLPERLRRHESLTGATPAERLVLAMLAMQLSLAGQDAAKTVALAERALAGGALLFEQEPDSQPYYMAFHALVHAGRYDAALRYGLLAVEDAERRGSLIGFVVGSMAACHALWRAGDLVAAEGHGQAALDALLAQGGSPALAPVVAALLLPVSSERGDGDRLLDATGTAGVLPELTICNQVLHARGLHRLAQQQATAALADFLELAGRDAVWGVVNPGAWPTRGSTALARLALGDDEAASALAGENLALARRWGTPEAVAPALRVAALTDRSASSVELLRESVSLAERSQARLEHARSLVELGAALRRDGHAADAREPLRHGLDEATRSGARRLAARARDELIAAGGRPRRSRSTGVDALTASERRVAQLAADGLANREIAQILFVTVRTVEGHLTNAYTKLGIATRAGLGPALNGGSPAPAPARPASPSRARSGGRWR